MMALLEPEEASKNNVWAKRLESACSPSDYMVILSFYLYFKDKFINLLP
jgi:hypothetical protein